MQIVFGNTEVTGARIVTKSKNESAIRKEKINFNNISDKASLVKMANELQYKKNYKGYEGAITGFLQPYCQPGFAATIIDPFYDKRNGKYMVESTSVTFGMSGARREIELGPVIGFNPDK